MKKKTMTNTQYFLIGGILGALFFLAIYGGYVLDVTNENWLLTGKDLTQHYIGWKYYRNSSWHFPIGLVEGLSYPYLTSVVYTDSIPLFAVPFKILSPLLPETFQYFGLFGLMCYILNGGFGALIVRKFSKNPFVIGCGSVFFIVTTPILQRLYGYLDITGDTRHTSLAAHFLLYAALLIWLNKDYFSSIKKAAIAWAVLGCLAIMIQSYFLPMILGIMCGCLLEDILTTKKWKKTVVSFASFGIASLGTMWILGAFYGNPSGGAGGFGIYSSNLNSLYNPYGYSAFLKDFPICEGNQEGMAYLGAGMLLMLLMGAAGFLYQTWKKKKSLKTLWKNRWKQIVSYGCVLLGAAVLALTNQVKFNGEQLVDIKLPDKILSFFSLVRSSGRFMWIVMYLIMILAICCIIKYYNAKVAIGIITLCMLLQVADFQVVYKNLGRSYNTKIEQTEVYLVSDVWENLVEEHEHVFVDLGMDQKMLFEIANFATDNKKTIDYFYFSRNYAQYLRAKIAKTHSVMEGKDLSPQTLYILSQKQADSLKDRKNESVGETSGINIYCLDGLYIGTSKEYSQLEQYQ